MNRLLAGLSLLLVSSPAFAAIEGNYIFKGTDPYHNIKYTGVVTITKGANGVYQGEWVHGERKYAGTGLLVGDAVSFITSGASFGAAFGEEEKPDYFLAVYKIKGNLLKGTWVRLGGDLVGTEDLEKKPE